MTAEEQLAAFLSVLNEPAAPPRFDSARPLLIARAPGRLDVMGGFADYSGSLTLELPLAEAAFVAVQSSSELRVRLVSVSPSGQRERVVERPLSVVRKEGSRWATAHRCFAQSSDSAWSGYVGGALTALAEDYGTLLETGLDLVLWSRVPEGKGVSSSAAIEVAALYGLAALLGIQLDPIQAALSCQRVENRVVGAPCGVMDQMAASCGVAGELLPLLCQPARLQPGILLPRELALWGVDSGIRHQVIGASYGEVRVAAFMGYRILAERLGLSATQVDDGHVRVHDRDYGGYLANLPLKRFESELASALPERLTGQAFLERYAGITDPVTTVRPEVTYRVRAATTHPVREHQRASEFLDCVERGTGIEAAPRLGQLMAEAHDSYGACGLGSTGTDRLVELVAEAGPTAGLFGAKITGGGSGGTVAVLGRRGADAAVARVAERYAAETGHEPRVFSGSSPGAAAFGVRRAVARGGRWQLE